MDRTLIYSGERFQKDSVSVSGFTRFRVERRSIYVKKVNYVVENIRIRVGRGLKLTISMFKIFNNLSEIVN